MGLSRSTKIWILLFIDSGFFFVELIAGYAVGSLALVADSFHMLNDVMSLIVALYAIKLTAASKVSPEYSYGWHRAEILAALINGVFLLALCFSIFIEAIERFFSVPEVGNPQLVVIVGSLGLLSNIVGLFLFHEHDHGHSHSHADPSTPPPKPKVLPAAPATEAETSPLLASPIGELPMPATQWNKKSPPSSPTRVHRRTDSIGRSVFPRRRSNSGTSVSVHPAQVRASLLQVAEDLRAEGEAASQPGDFVSTYDDDESTSRVEEGRYSTHDHGRRNDLVSGHDDDNHSTLHNGVHSHDHAPPAKPVAGGGHDHGHGSMNMRAVLLHVMGDALGNVGVIATGLVIWFTSWKYKYYCDPFISLVITCIIFSSALPLVRSASFILLQGVPASISLEEVRNAILDIPGVLSMHELHIWQLSESKIVASVHVLVRKSLKGCPPIQGAVVPKKLNAEDETENRELTYMTVASEIRRVLHSYGIHSSTIQPEYALDGTDEETASLHSACLIPCMTDADCDPANACCPPTPRATD